MIHLLPKLTSQMNGLHLDNFPLPQKKLLNTIAFLRLLALGCKMPKHRLSTQNPVHGLS